MLRIFAQGIGFVGTAVLFVAFQMPEKKKILFFQIISITIFALHYFMLGLYTGNYTGMVMNIVAMVRTTLFYFEDKKWFRPYLFTGIFLFIIIYIGIDTWKNIYSLFPIIAMVDSTICLNIKKEKYFRIFNFPGSPLWLVYGIYSRSYSGIIGEICTMISIIIAIIRYDILHMDKKQTKLFKAKKQRS